MTIGRVEIAEVRHPDGQLAYVVTINERRHNGTFPDRPAAVRSARALARRYAGCVFKEDAEN